MPESPRHDPYRDPSPPEKPEDTFLRPRYRYARALFLAGLAYFPFALLLLFAAGWKVFPAACRLVLTGGTLIGTSVMLRTGYPLPPRKDDP